MAGRHGLLVRAATAADAEGVAELMSAVGRPVSTADIAGRLAAIRDSRCGCLLLALEWGPPSGMLAWHWYPTPGADMPLAQIDWLAVPPDDRRRGIARTLLKSASQAARVVGCGSMSLTVPPHADGTLEAFCSASGFEPGGGSFTRSLRKARGEP